MQVAMVNPRKNIGKKKSSSAANKGRKRKKPMTKRQAQALKKAWKARGMKVPPKIMKAAGRSNPKRKRKTTRKRNVGKKNIGRKKKTGRKRKSNVGKKKNIGRKKKANYGTTAAGKKAWRTRRRLYGASGMKKGKRRRSNPKRKKRTTKRRSNYGTSRGAKRGWTKRKAKYGKSGRKRRSSNPMVKGYRYYKPSAGKWVTVKGHRRSKGRRRRNPAAVYRTKGGFLPTMERIQKQFYIFPRKMVIPTWKEIQAHPILFTAGGVGGVVSSSIGGGVGRMIGGKNVFISEVLAMVGHVVSTELPARFVSLFHFKGNMTMAKGIRMGGYITMAFSAILSLVRIIASIKNNGLKDTITPRWEDWGVGQITLPKLTEIPAAIVKTMGLGAFSVDNPLADLVTSGKQQGYTGWEPMNISDDRMDPFVGDEFMDTDEGMPDDWWNDQTLGEPQFVKQIKDLAKELGLSDDEVMARASGLEYDNMDYNEEELDGIGQISVPKSHFDQDMFGPHSEFVE